MGRIIVLNTELHCEEKVSEVRIHNETLCDSFERKRLVRVSFILRQWANSVNISQENFTLNVPKQNFKLYATELPF